MAENNLAEAEQNIEDILGADLDVPEKVEDEIIVLDPSEVKTEEKKVEKQKYVFDEETNNEINKKINNRVDQRVGRVEKILAKKIEAEREAYIGAIANVQERLNEALEKNSIKDYKVAEDALNKLNAKKEELDDELKDYKEGKSKEVAEDDVGPKQKKNVNIDEAAGRWLQSNKQFAEKIDADPELSAVARAISQKLLKNGYNEKPQIELLAEVKKQMLRKMPEEFDGIATKDEIPNVSGGKMDMGSNGIGGGKKVYTINDVPALDRQILRNYVKAGVYKDEKDAVTKFFQRKQQESR